APLNLKRGAYHLTVEFRQPAPALDNTEAIVPQYTGFQLKYSGPDTGKTCVAVPFKRLYQDRKDHLLSDGLNEALHGTAFDCLQARFSSSLRDIRRTYQRAFKAMLFAHRFELSAQPISDSGQSEIGYMLVHPQEFAGSSYYLNGGAYTQHQAV